MRTIFAGILSVPLLLLVAGADPADSQETESPRIRTRAELAPLVDAFVEPFVLNYEFDGFVAVQHQGQTIVSRSFGGEGRSYTPWTPFPIGSITKTFTAEAIRLLESDGLLRYEWRISIFSTAIPLANQISIEQLLTHSSGLADYYAIPEFREARETATTPTAFAEWISRFPLDFLPGSDTSYSNSGYNLLAHIVETTAEQPFADYLAARILNPLGLDSTGSLERTDPERFAEGAEPGHGPGRLRRPRSVHASWLTGSGSMYSTADDLLKWATIVGNRMRRGEPVPYGWGVRQRGTDTYLEQSGRIPGYSAHLRVYPDSMLVVAALSRIESDAVNELADGVAELAFGTDLEPLEVREITTMSVADLAEYEGTYQISPSFRITVALDRGGLGVAVGEGPGLDYAALDHLGDDRFFFRVGNTEVVFVRDATARVNGLDWGGLGFVKIDTPG